MFQKITLAIIAVFVLSACNAFEQYYTPSNVEIKPGTQWLQQGQKPRIEPAATLEEFESAIAGYMADYYVPLGTSQFKDEQSNSSFARDIAAWDPFNSSNDRRLEAHARNIGATLAIKVRLHESTYLKETSDGSYYSDKKEVISTQHSSEESFDKYQVYVQYMVRQNAASDRIFGTRFERRLNDEERRALGRNTGVVVTIVLNDSPAFQANVIPGDVIVGLNGANIVSIPDFQARVAAHVATKPAGSALAVKVLRSGTAKDLVVLL